MTKTRWWDDPKEIINVPKSDKRNAYLDWVKGITIIFVVWGHVIQYFSYDSLNFFDNPVFKFLYSFHMPLFMLVSGYLYFYSLGKRTAVQAILQRMKELGIAIFTWGTLQYILIAANNIHKGSFSFSIRDYVSQLLGIWFLWSVLAASVIVALIEKVIPVKWLRNLLLLTGFPILFFLPNSALNLYMYPFFVIGFKFNEYRKVIPEKAEKLKYLSFIIFPCLLFFFQERDYIYTSGINPFSSEYGILTQIGIDVYRWGIGLAGSVFILSIIQIVYENQKKKDRLSTRDFKIIASIGQFSLQIYMIQTFVLERISTEIFRMAVDKLGYNPLTFNVILFDLIAFLIAFVFTITIWIISKGIKKIPRMHKVFFGR